MNIGIDFHDTFTYAPQFFINLIKNCGYKSFIVTGTPNKDKQLIIDSLKSYGIYDSIADILMGYNYEKENMTVDHFHKMAKHKLDLLINNNIKIYFDDNPFYASYMKDYGITVFQTIVNNEYIASYKLKDPYFSCHLQEKQFEFLKHL